MLQVTVPLSQSDFGNNEIAEDLHPEAAAIFEFSEKERHVHVELKGVIIGRSADQLAAFLTNIAAINGNKWTIQMQHLHVLSLEGIRHLARFARQLCQLGFALEVRGIQRNVYNNLLELNLDSNFGWAV